MLRLRSRLARSLCPLARVTMAPSLCLAGGENVHPSFPGTGHPWRPLTRCHVMTAGGRTCRTCLCVMWQHSAAEANLARSRGPLGGRFPLHASRFPLESGGQCRPDKAARYEARMTHMPAACWRAHAHVPRVQPHARPQVCSHTAACMTAIAGVFLHARTHIRTRTHA